MGREQAKEDNCESCCMGWKKVATDRAMRQLERRFITGWSLWLHSKEAGFCFVLQGGTEGFKLESYLFRAKK